MKRSGTLSWMWVLAVLVGGLVGCNFQSLKGNPINPYIQWSVINRVNITDVVKMLATSAAQWGFVPSSTQ